MSKDYYATLGVERGSDEKTIKAAYRRLARRYHPDVNPNDAASEAKFKEVTEAYEVLGDPEKRKLYDQYGANWEHAQNFGAGERFDFSGDLTNIFDQFFGGVAESRAPSAPPQDIEKVVELSLEEIDRGTERKLTYQAMETCKTCEGAGQVRTKTTRPCVQCRGTGRTRGLFGSAQTCAACDGSGSSHMDRCPTCRGAGRIPATLTVPVKIPAGVSEGKKLRVPGRGTAGSNGRRGDLYVVVKEAAHPVFKRKGDDLEQEVAVPYTVAALGGEIRVPTLDGMVSLRVPEGSQSGQAFRLAGKGMARLGGGRGNMIVRLRVTVPKTLSERERKLLEELASISGVAV
jgi:chaperone protein DnaJ